MSSPLKRRSALTSLLAAAALAVAVAPAQADFTSDVTANEVTVTGTANNDLLEITTSGGFLSHSAAGPGYSSGIDWNSSGAITETVPLAANLVVRIDGGGADDLIRVGNDQVSAGDVPFPFDFRGGNGTDALIFDMSKDTALRGADFFADDIHSGATFSNTASSYSVWDVENTVVSFGSGNDPIQVDGTNPFNPLSIGTGPGDDTIHVGTPSTGLAPLRGSVSLFGEAGTDTLTVSDAPATQGSLTSIDATGLRHGSGAALSAPSIESRRFTAGSGADGITKAGGVPWTIDSGAGDDSVTTRDSVGDAVSCGDGSDFAVVDDLDSLSACEGTSRAVAGGGPQTPVPAGEGSGGGTTGPGAGGGTPATDRSAPRIGVGGLKKTVRLKSLLRGIRPKLTADEPAAWDVTLLGSARQVRLARAGDVTLAHASAPLAAGSPSVRLKPSKKLVGRARRFKVRVAVTATDAAGNRTTVTRTVKVKR